MFNNSNNNPVLGDPRPGGVLIHDGDHTDRSRIHGRSHTSKYPGALNGRHNHIALLPHSRQCRPVDMLRQGNG